MLRSLLLLSVLVAAVAHAESPRRITYDMSGLPLTLTVDASGTTQIEGLPYPGEVLYQRSTGTVFYHHPNVAEWLAIPPTQLNDATTSATITAGPKWQPWPATGNPQPTQRWDIKAENHPATCDEYFASPTAARMAGLDASDLTRILATLQWLNSGRIANPCEALILSATQGEKIGLPILFTGPNGPWQLQEVVTTQAEAQPLPAATPLTEDLRLQLLLSQFSPEDRIAFLQKNSSLPIAQQIEALADQLNAESLP